MAPCLAAMRPSLRHGCAVALCIAAALVAGDARSDDAPQDSQQVPAAWVGRHPGSAHFSGLVDWRGFYNWTHGVGGARPDWKGGELLSYFDLLDGLSGAFILRHEVRDQIADYGTLMLIPRISPTQYLVLSLGIGNGADFLPVTRMDVQLRGFFKEGGKLMYDVGGYVTWWTDDRQQLAQSDALIFWYNPLIVEARGTAILTDPGFGPWRPNYKGSVTVLYGADRQSWLLLQLQMGNEPENAPGIAFAYTPDLLVVDPSIGYRYWITPDYGVNAQVEFFYQVRTWERLGLVTSIFASF